MLFELVCGTPPFGGNNPLEVAEQRLRKPVPSVHARAQNVPEGLDLIIQRMLEPDPARRYQRAGDAALDFERALTLLDTAKRASMAKLVQQEITLPPTANWFDSPETSTGNAPRNIRGNNAPAPALAQNQQQAAPSTPAGNNGRSLAGIDPFDWWSSQASGEVGRFKSQGKPARS